ncbi:hypothetical protein HYFRA_00007083 [Hymenoscyphus fraxineus]|uniref:Uncharacterized protein n=1 Tax=Hymenoscyphus fraxineus TaxID=746836 RepID=A0A9N9PIX3_9HELO|nr:hypothetical protein HYFRA_00007083 [Hymenoscyphus fraxineus]
MGDTPPPPPALRTSQWEKNQHHQSYKISTTPTLRAMTGQLLVGQLLRSKTGLPAMCKPGSDAVQCWTVAPPPTENSALRFPRKAPSLSASVLVFLLDPATFP